VDERTTPRIAGLAWLSGALLLAGLVLVVTHLAEERALADLLRRAKPAWLLAAFALQVATYACAAGVWWCALRGRALRPRFASLVPLGVAKLFTDQAVPSAGLSGTLLVVRGLSRRGVARGDAMAAMLAGLTSFYAAYAIVVLAAVVALARLGELRPAFVALAAVLGLVAAAVPAVALGLRGRHAPRLAALSRRLPGVRALSAALAEVPPGAVARPRVLAEAIALQLAVFALDVATLAAMLAAAGTTAPLPIVFVSFVFASVVATLAWVPGGIGTFEGSCVLMLHGHGVALETALAATLLLRGFTFWLPMLPGLVLAHRELRAGA